LGKCAGGANSGGKDEEHARGLHMDIDNIPTLGMGELEDIGGIHPSLW
jgi:hypothetical protein